MAFFAGPGSPGPAFTLSRVITMSKQIIVKSTVDGFRRAGIGFNREGVVLTVSELSSEQLDAIKAEPKLIVGDYVDPDAKPDNKQKAADKAADKAAAEKAAAEKAAAEKAAAEQAAADKLAGNK